MGLLGARGRMGKWVCQLIATEFEKVITLNSEVNREDPLEPLLKTDVVIDFSSPERMIQIVRLALKKPKNLPPFVVGSTGWNDQTSPYLEELGQKTSVLVAANFSMGIFTLSKILRQFSPLLKKLGYTSVIVETHHCHKKDSPSGTANFLKQSMSAALGQPPLLDIPIHSIRAGEVVGDHEVSFFGAADKITVGHFAQDRSIFARGAIQAALWLAQRQKENPEVKGVIGIEHYFESVKESLENE